MAASAGTVTLNLDANSVKLLRELQKAERGSKKTAHRMRKEFSDAFKAIAVASAAAATAFGYMAKKSIDAMDNLAKMSAKVGVSTESLSQLEFAAQLSGTSLEGLNTGLLRLSRTASDAANGLTTAQRAFDAIGVSAQKSDGSLKATDEILLEVADKFAVLEDGAAKAALAQELFGRSGAQLIPLLNKGRDGIAELTAEADRLGLTIDSSAAAAAERFNDNITRLQSATKGLVNQTTAQLLPTLEAISDRFIEGIATTDGMSRAVEQLVTAFKLLTSVAMTAYHSLQIAGTAIGGFFAWLVASEFGTKDVNLGVWDDIRAQGQQAADDLYDVWNAVATKIERPAAQIRGALTFGEGGATESSGSSIESLSENARRAQQIIASTRNEYERFADAAVEAYALLNEGLINQEVFDRWLDAHKVRMEEVEVAAEETFDHMSVFADQAARNMQDQFANFLFDPFKDGLGGMLRGFADTLRRMAAEAAASAIFKAIGASMAGSGTGWIAALGASFGGGKASGGPVSAGGTYLVGERGPELLQMGGKSGNIVPNHALGGTVMVNIDARQNDDPGRLLALVPVIQNQIEQGMALKMRRGYL